MANDKIETTFKNPLFEPKYTKNMFTEVIGNKYAKKFHDVFYSDIESRDQKMKEIYEEAKTDQGLKKIQKEIISKCYIAYLAAVGANGNISVPIISFLDKKKPLISKVLRSDVRIKRMLWDLSDVVERSGFEFEVFNFPDLLKVFMVQFNQKDKDELDNDDYMFEYIILTTLSKFVRTLPTVAIINIWYALMFMKNIASLAYIKKETFDDNEQIKPQVTSIMRTLYAINIKSC